MAVHLSISIHPRLMIVGCAEDAKDDWLSAGKREWASTYSRRPPLLSFRIHFIYIRNLITSIKMNHYSLLLLDRLTYRLTYTASSIRPSYSSFPFINTSRRTRFHTFSTSHPAGELPLLLQLMLFLDHLIWRREFVIRILMSELRPSSRRDNHRDVLAYERRFQVPLASSFFYIQVLLSISKLCQSDDTTCRFLQVTFDAEDWYFKSEDPEIRFLLL